MVNISKSHADTFLKPVSNNKMKWLSLSGVIAHFGIFDIYWRKQDIKFWYKVSVKLFVFYGLVLSGYSKFDEWNATTHFEKKNR